ncbi:hypothetical protein Hanom_Chr09g00802441 [Helianthus anomalus]
MIAVVTHNVEEIGVFGNEYVATEFRVLKNKIRSTSDHKIRVRSQMLFRNGGVEFLGQSLATEGGNTQPFPLLPPSLVLSELSLLPQTDFLNSSSSFFSFSFFFFLLWIDN